MRRPRRAAVGVLSPRRALKLGKIRRRACLRLIPFPGTGDVLLAPTMISHPLAYVVSNPRQHAPGCAVPRHVPLGEPQSDAWVGELERRPGVVTRRGKWLAAVAVLPHLGTCRSPGLAGARGASR